MKYTLLILTSIAIGFMVKPYQPTLFVSKPSVGITGDFKQDSTPSPTPTPSRSEVIFEVSQQFDQFGADVVAQSILVAKNESGWKHNSQGWNCHYKNEEGKVYSAACKVEDRPNAWSVDCGVMQVNVKGKSCPAEMFDIKKNIAKAVSMYKKRKWNPWVAAHNLGYVK